MALLDFDIDLNDKQVDMYNALNDDRYREVLFYGTGRSGKSFLILYWFIVQSVVYKANCLIARATFSSLSTGMVAQTMPAVLNAIAKLNGFNSWKKLTTFDMKPFCSFNAKTNTLKFFNDAYIQFTSLRGSADNDSSYDKILSTEWGHIFVDEVSEVDEKAIDILRTRLAQRLPVRNKMLFALNPTSKAHWSYQRFFVHKDRDGESIGEKVIESFLVMHFNINDNKKFVASDYEETLENMSYLQRKRFLDGEYVDESEGEIFKAIPWDDLPEAKEFTQCIIYTDPSPTSSKRSDYKASVMVGVARSRFWVVDIKAVQGTSMEMIRNIHQLYLNAPCEPKIYMEAKQMPVDFKKTFEQYQNDNEWICPLIYDTRVMGDKFTHIESTLEPLFSTKRIGFNREIKNGGCGEITVNQFLYFSHKEQRDRKDDIPDATAKAVSLLNRNFVKTPRKQSASCGLIVKRGTRTDF